MLAACVGVRAATLNAAERYAIVPRTLEEIANPNFAGALAARADDYDELDRREQVVAFVQVYRSLNRGQDPLLSPQDAEYLGWPDGSVWASPETVGGPARYWNTRSGDMYTYIEGYGYRRTPAVTARSRVSQRGTFFGSAPRPDDLRRYYGLPDEPGDLLTTDSPPGTARLGAIRHRAAPMPSSPPTLSPRTLHPRALNPELPRPGTLSPRTPTPRPLLPELPEPRALSPRTPTPRPLVPDALDY